MADPIPNEDYITHTQLWKRIDAARDSINGTMQGMEGHWQESVTAVVSQIQSLLEENKKFMDQKQADIQADMKTTTEQFKAINDEAVATLCRKLDEYMGKVETRFNNLQIDLTKKFDEANSNFVSDSKIGASDLKKELELSVNNSVTQVVHKVNDHKRDIDIRFNGLESIVEKSAQVEVEKYFHEIVGKVNGMVDADAEFRQQISDAITKFQSDTGLRFSTVDTKLQTVLDKLRGILKEL